MSTTEDELNKIAALSYLDTNNTPHLLHDVSAIMDYVEQLRQIDTTDIIPLLHPLGLHQRLRADEVNDVNHAAELANLAPLFVDNLYLVPKVIDTGK